MTSAPNPSKSRNLAPGERLPAAQQRLTGKGRQRRGSQPAALLSHQVRRLPEEGARPALAPLETGGGVQPGEPAGARWPGQAAPAPLRCPRRPGPRQPLCPETLEPRTPRSRRLSAGTAGAGAGWRRGSPAGRRPRANTPRGGGLAPPRPASPPANSPAAARALNLPGPGGAGGEPSGFSLLPPAEPFIFLPAAARRPGPGIGGGGGRRGWGPRGARRRGTARRAGRVAPGSGGRCG